ncbi:MAG: KH domain-containing protein [Thermomicrobiales bacterium]
MEEASPAEALRELVLYMANNLVDEPAGVTVTAEQRGTAVHLDLRVPEPELGKVIGRQGRIARAMRTVVMVAGSRYNVRASLDIDG